MPDFTIETTYLLPIFRHRTFAAETLEAACRAAIEDDNWDIAEKDYESPGEVHVTGVWDGTHSAYTGPSMPVPPQFDEAVQRRARHFEILLGLLKIFFDDAHAARPPSPDWLTRSAWEIARGQAILGRAPDPDQPVDSPKASHILARLQEDQVRNAIVAVLDVDRSFGALSPAAVTDDEIHVACLNIATTMDLSDVVGNAEFQAALAAIRAAHRRLYPD
ncbi:hypothetical protein [Neorhizobium galegae]|uniref:hypothetical protein n=1 Tax=Neorhizobium galegae TaxID=399 RepID=UPI0006212B65|nr:hypothetical protein [Neorhizobium galegae]CDZ56604.1 Hypothetical protein NGAL_HAMBI2566_11550 [Neorhizobium galegae bv. orientalis]KAB1122687.1 hypothetical protein F4V90_18410 [Neorhizobium galegae]MCQ1570280.1 hypothetical protein [Neorhizobium galegae]MCQ1807879.1 hypothetical protein [Neorhizobium galegae]MCQ1838419.1 hypothetical protein [Neorhizobium galegae]